MRFGVHEAHDPSHHRAGLGEPNAGDGGWYRCFHHAAGLAVPPYRSLAGAVNVSEGERSLVDEHDFPRDLHPITVQRYMHLASPGTQLPRPKLREVETPTPIRTQCGLRRSGRVILDDPDVGSEVAGDVVDPSFIAGRRDADSQRMEPPEFSHVRLHLADSGLVREDGEECMGLDDPFWPGPQRLLEIGRHRYLAEDLFGEGQFVEGIPPDQFEGPDWTGEFDRIDVWSHALEHHRRACNRPVPTGREFVRRRKPANLEPCSLIDEECGRRLVHLRGDLLKHLIWKPRVQRADGRGIAAEQMRREGIDLIERGVHGCSPGERCQNVSIPLR